MIKDKLIKRTMLKLESLLFDKKIPDFIIDEIELEHLLLVKANCSLPDKGEERRFN